MQIQIYETLVVQVRGEVHGVPGAKLCCGSGEDSGLNLSVSCKLMLEHMLPSSCAVLRSHETFRSGRLAGSRSLGASFEGYQTLWVLPPL